MGFDVPLICWISVSGSLFMPLLRPRGVDRPALVVHLEREHDAVAQVRVVRDREQLVARLALAVHPGPQVLGIHESMAVNGNAGTFLESLKKTLRCMF